MVYRIQVDIADVKVTEICLFQLQGKGLKLALQPLLNARFSVTQLVLGPCPRRWPRRVRRRRH
jgi:hypothetical protein